MDRWTCGVASLLLLHRRVRKWCHARDVFPPHRRRRRPMTTMKIVAARHCYWPIYPSFGTLSFSSVSFSSFSFSSCPSSPSSRGCVRLSLHGRHRRGTAAFDCCPSWQLSEQRPLSATSTHKRSAGDDAAFRMLEKNHRRCCVFAQTTHGVSDRT